MCAIRRVLGVLFVSSVGAGVHGWNSDEPSLHEACANAYDYGDPVCVGDSTLYWGTGNRSDLSCAHCVCDEGWSGADCGRCDDISVCPSKMDVDGQTVAATNCSADTLLLTEEEARSDAGKVFSCSCGGGEDGWTDFLCGQQPDTWIQFGVTGGGTDDDPAFVVLKEFAGIHARTEESWPGQYDYHYPKIFDGSAGPCKVYRDKCFEIDGTDVGQRDCVIYECGDTEGVCPPEEYPMCDGFPHCKTADDKEYTTHPCTAVPISGTDITIACQEEKVNGSFVCYYQQTGGFAPLSMTCSVGSCLYQGGIPVQPTGSRTKKVSWSIGVQMTILVSLGGLLVMTFVLFAVATDPGTAETAAAAVAAAAVAVAAAANNKGGGGAGPPSKRRTLLDKVLLFNRGDGAGSQQQVGGGYWDDDDLGAPLLGGAGGSESGATIVGHAVGGGSSERLRQLGAGGGGGAAVGDARSADDPGGGGGRGRGGGGGWEGGTVIPPKDLQQQQQQRLEGGQGPNRPAVLWWNKLGYYVHGQGQRRGAEMAVLRGVSGFAGPELNLGGRSGAQSLAPLDTEVGEGAAAAAVGDGGGALCGDGSFSAVRPSKAAPSGCVPSTMTGILGPSGAGKSSLLDILAGRKRLGEGRTTGSISLAYGDDGRARMESGAEAVRRVGGYVSQEDVLPGTLTCYEHLMFHARLRMPPGSSFSERAERVLWVLEELGLQRVADSRIGDELKRGLSGGERRRLSIATELVARPALLFADEPTTGLDAATALRVMTLLSGVASRGTTVLCSLHQPRPRVLNLLDKVILLSKGQVAYFGSPRDAEPFFRSIGRPFPADQPHPADAMLTLCCREDGRDLPLLFRRSARSFPFTTSGTPVSPPPPPPSSTTSTAAAAAAAGGSLLTEIVTAADDDEALAVSERQRRGDEGGRRLLRRPSPPLPPLRSGEQERGGRRREGGLPVSISGSLNDREERDYSSGGTTELVEVGGGRRAVSPGARDGGAMPGRRRRRRHHRSLSGGVAEKGEAAGDERNPAPFLVQVEALSRRLLLRAVRHPLLLVLHFGGSVAMALCLASVFGGRLGFNLAGAQDRFGALFFLLLYLSLLSLTSLPVWREDRRLFLSEAMGGAYGHLPYFTSVALADILLVRVLPPLAFAVVGYPLMGLNAEPDNPGCLLWFAGILVLANVTVALAAMGVGALGLPLDLSNLVGGLMVLLLASFGRFLLNGTRIPSAWRWLSSVTPLGYAFEALLINEFSDADGRRPYVIEGSHCSPDLPVVEPLGPQILATFSFSSERSTMHLDVVILMFIALGLSLASLLVFFFATRTKPLVVDFLPPPRHTSLSGTGGGRRASSPRNVPSHTSSERNAERGHGHVPSTPITAAAPAASSGSSSAAGRHRAGENERGQQLSPELPADAAAAAAAAGGDMVPTATGARTVSWNVPGSPGSSATTIPPLGRGSGDGGGARGGEGGGRSDARFSKTGGGSGDGGSRRSSRAGGRRVNARTGAGLGATPPAPPPPLLLSWEGVRYEVAVPRRKRAWFGAGENSSTSSAAAVGGAAMGHGAGETGLLVLDGVSGFAGPSSRASRRAVAAAPASAAVSAESGPSPASEAEDPARGGRRDASSSNTGSDDRGDGWQGTVTAIMGPSGAGKTSLLNALAGRIETVNRGNFAGGGSGWCRGGGSGGGRLGLTGEVRLNGEAVGAADIRNLSAYVTQEDILPETLTCYEHLMFHAQLRLPRRTPMEGRHERVMEVLQQLGLEDVRNSRVGGGLTRGISGGEKRRLSIGTELLTRPALLFLDEPTTGLDSSTALRVMQLVSSVALRGTTVVCSVHQPRPEVVRLINKVILLSRGAVAFSGSPSAAEAHFASIGRPFLPLVTETGAVALKVDPADAILDAVGDAEARVDREGTAGVDGGLEGGGGLVVMPRELLVEEVREAEASGPPPISLHGADGDGYGTRKSPPVLTQLSALLRRSVINVARDPYLAGLHLVLTLCVGLVVGTLFRDLSRLNGCTAGVQDRLGVVFLLLLYLSLLCLTSLAAWRKQMSLFLHERASGAYGAAAHLAAAASVDALACRIVPPVLLALTVRPLTALRSGSLPGLTAGLIAFNLSLAGVLAACGAGAKSSQEALATGCLVVLFSALLSGFLVSKDDLPWAWGRLAWLSPIGRGFEALVANEFSPYGAVFELSTKIGSAPTVYTDPLTGDQILHCFGFDGSRYLQDLGVLAAVGACGLALAFVFLKRSR